MNSISQTMKRRTIALIATVGCLSSAFLIAKTAKSDPDPAVDHYLGVQYTTAGTPESMDIFMPQVTDAHMPTIVYVHGGGWGAGNRSGGDGFAKFFTDRGYVFCTIDYRLSGVAKYPAQIEDCKCAIRFLRANADKYHVDPNHIGAWGDSAGGHLVALLGTTANVERLEGKGGWQNQPSNVQAVLDWYGPTDLSRNFQQTYTNQAGINMIKGFLGNPINEQLANDASPALFVKKGLPPFLIMHGDKDPLVPIAQSQELYDKLKAAGDDATFKIVPGAGHGGSQFLSPENIVLVDNFFNRTLKS